MRGWLDNGLPGRQVIAPLEQPLTSVRMVRDSSRANYALDPGRLRENDPPSRLEDVPIRLVDPTHYREHTYQANPRWLERALFVQVGTVVLLNP